LRSACADAATWPDDVRVSINLSATQFKNRSLVPNVVNALGSSGLQPRRLELEITESVLMMDDEITVAMLYQLTSLGLTIALDDFGTGYSSLSYLQKFPFDRIKIDQSFIRGVAKSHDSMAIVRAIAGLARSLNMTTVAEGVETEEQAERANREGCTEAQGYLFSRPIPAKKVSQLLGRGFERSAMVA
jgi:EAL domain-containing protein (putative c-di-GMP-specific phosphodiesterase class I)